MAGIRKSGGHAVTGVLPPSSDAVQVKAAQPSFPAGGGYTDSMAKKKASGFPPAR